MNLGNSEPRQVASESSVQRLPLDQPLQPGRGANKRRRRDQNGGGDERDGPRYPRRKVAILSFECPFCKLDPHRYEECRGYRLTRLSDVMQHIKRQHLILEVRLGLETLKEEDIILYCTRCRYLFHGLGAALRLGIHLNEKIPCQIANIEQSGVMVLLEFEGLRRKLRSYARHSERFRWNIIWDWCFPGKPCPPSPYVDIILPRPQVHLIIQEELQSVQGLPQREIQSIVRRSADRIYNTSSAPSETRSSPSVPPQARPDTVQRAPEPTYSSPTYIHPNQAFPPQPLQPQSEGFGYNSELPNAGVSGTPNASQRENSLFWNYTFTTNSAPSQSPDFRTFENNTVDSEVYTAPLESIIHDDHDLNDFTLYGNAANRRCS
ncbi:hypothetical protein DER46DRAFT_641994 [Fusarium sp. MPI-SDFR-AT-0072]|nr:hypothetical protein DER46DRAFT_641994 [Fusarium sp. MPI-SDFR-AT-0072]